MHVLLVEDNPVNLRLASRMLQKQGHTVREANNGLDALGVLACESFDVILMDIQMTKMDGLAKPINKTELRHVLAKLNPNPQQPAAV